MNELIFESWKLVVMIAAAIFVRYITPTLKELQKYVAQLVEDLKEKRVTQWAIKGVNAAEQLHKAETGEEKKQIVTETLQGLRDEIGSNLTDKQLEILLEAAVRAMNEEKKRIEKKEEGEGNGFPPKGRMSFSVFC